MHRLVKTHSVLCPLLSKDQLCIHFGGSLEQGINEYDYEYEYELHSQAKWLAYQKNLQLGQLYNMKNQFKRIVFITGQSRTWQKLCFNSYKCNEICAEKSRMQVMSEVTYGSYVYWHYISSYSTVIFMPLVGWHPGKLSEWLTP